MTWQAILRQAKVGDRNFSVWIKFKDLNAYCHSWENVEYLDSRSASPGQAVKPDQNHDP